MAEAVFPRDEAERLDRLCTVVPELRDGQTDPVLSGIADAAAELCDTPIALVSLVAENNQYFMARRGLDAASTPRKVSFCAWAILGDEPFVVPDATADSRFHDNPLVTGPPHIVYYAGVPLITADGRHRLGTLCVIDRVPRELCDAQIDGLRALADATIGILEERHELRSTISATQTVLDSIADCVLVTDADGRVAYVNPAARAMLGDGATIGAAVDDVLPLDPVTCGGKHPIHRALQERRAVTLPEGATMPLGNGRYIEIDDSAAPTFDSRGDLSGAVMVFRNVTAERELARRLAWRGTHDSLTELVNRESFDELLAEMLETGRARKRCWVLYVDLDRFKGVNDELGHSVGDDLLVRVASVLQAEAGEADTVARLGGDEFAVLLRDADAAYALGVATRMLDGVRQMRSAFCDHRASVDASVGVVGLAEASLTVEEVLRRADLACHAAKHSGGGRVQLFDPELAEIEEWRGSVHWMHEIQLAIAEDRFELYGQPIVPVGPAGHVGFEVLLRLRIDDEIVAPGVFIPAAERFRLTRAVDRWVVGRTVEWIAANPTVLGDLDTVHINLCGQSIGDPEFADEMRRLIETAEIEPSLLCFEITESNAVAELGRSHEFFDALTEIGCRFALDDFGRGFSSYDYLRRFPVDVVKIDGSFVTDVADDDIAREMVRSIVSVAGLLGKTTVAECVEDQQALEVLTSLGVDAAQGYHLGRPVPIDDLFGQAPDVYDEAGTGGAIERRQGVRTLSRSHSNAR